MIYKGKLAGFSTGNEVAGGLGARSANWLVPSKVFTGCASLGPCIATPESIPDPMSLALELVPVPRWEGDCAIARCRRGSNGRPKRSSPPPLPTTRPPIWSFSTPEDSLRYPELPTPGGRCRADHHGGSRIRPETLSRSSNGCGPVPTQHSATSSGFWKLSLDPRCASRKTSSCCE